MAGSNRCRDTGCLGRGCSCFFSVHSGVYPVNLQQNTASCPIFVVHQSSPWCTSNQRPRERLTKNSPHLCRQAHLTWWVDEVLSVCMLYLTPSTNFSHLLCCHGTWRVITLFTEVPTSDSQKFPCRTLSEAHPQTLFACGSILIQHTLISSRSRSLKRCLPLMFTINIKVIGVALSV